MIFTTHAFWHLVFIVLLVAIEKEAGGDVSYVVDR
jgi:hypothetical protein